ncbi:MAG: type II toxin-antitoxin system prevent-host-death family antitoxin [Bacillota bacterium]
MESVRVSIRETKAHLSRLLKEVRRGTEVIITDRGIPVGRIVPVSKQALSVAERVKELERRGLIESQRARPKMDEIIPLPVPPGLAQKMLQEDREG